MEPQKIRTKILSQIQHMVGCAIIKDRRFLDDEQLIRSEQLAVLEEIFNANVRDTEIRELSSHFAAILRASLTCYLRCVIPRRFRCVMSTLTSRIPHHVFGP